MGLKYVSWIAFFSLTRLTSCNHERDAALPPLAVPPSEQVASLPLSAQLKALDAALEPTSELAPYLADIRLMLEALQAEKEEDFPLALKKWQATLEISQGAWASKAFHSWLTLYAKSLQAPAQDLFQLAQLVLNEATKSHFKDYLQANGINEQAKLAAYLSKHHRQLGIVLGLEARQTLPLAPGIPKEDRLLLASAENYCRASGSEASWEAWQKSLEPLVLSYWLALVQLCHNENAKAIEAFKQVAPLLSAPDKTSFHALALTSYQKLVLLLRQNDGRHEAASYYNALIEAWKLPGLSPDSMGLTVEAFTFAKIDDWLWAARYQALIADYAQAQAYVQEALALISSAFSHLPQLSPEIVTKLAGLKADAYHIQAFRIAVERHEYLNASSIIRQALGTPYLGRQWQARLQWYLGFYEYLAGNLQQAVNHWQKLVAYEDKGLRAKVLFWLAVVYQQTGFREQSKTAFANLVAIDPLGFYPVVASQLTGLAEARAWQQLFPEPLQLEKKLEELASTENIPLPREQSLGILIARLEVLLSAGLSDWAVIASQELLSATKARLPLSEEDSYLYLTRLLYGAGLYHEAISLSHELAKQNQHFWRKHPEQIHIYFPRAYAREFRQHARKEAVEVALLYAIARQESHFDQEAISPAGAHGLMQVIPSTAQRLSVHASWNWQEVKSRLQQPAVNIGLGSLYLKLLSMRYQQQIPALIAAYNAGEYAVDMWLKHRQQPDPLLWLELIPFQETQDYVRKVWRNLEVYRYLGADRQQLVLHRKSFPFMQALLPSKTPVAR